MISERRSDRDGEAATVVVLGGTGFLGCRAVKCFANAGCTVRVAARQPGRARTLFAAERDRIEPVKVDIADPAALTAVMAGADIVVNAVSLYAEQGRATFRAVHVQGAERVAGLARQTGVRALVHMSGIGADPQAADAYIRSRGLGDEAVLAAFPEAVVVRSAVMVGAGDAFLGPLIRLVRRFPVIALFGRGETRLQPVYVGDVARAICCAAADARMHGAIHELGGPADYSFRQVVEAVARRLGRRRLLVPVPFAVWGAAAAVAERLPNPPLTRHQVALMRQDGVVTRASPLFESCDIVPTPFAEVLDGLMTATR